MDSSLDQVCENLFVAGLNGCWQTVMRPWPDPKPATVHACKSPCHQRALGYKGSLKRDDPGYLTFQQNNDLFLNMIDPEKPLFQPPLFLDSLRFISQQIKQRPVVIHCNSGMSRAPSIALLYLAKVGIITNKSYAAALEEFNKRYPHYEPSEGIFTYLTEHWSELLG